MTIEIERIEVLGVNVHDRSKAEDLFSRLFGLKFESLTLNDGGLAHEDLELQSGEKTEDSGSVLNGPQPLALDPTGIFELIEVGGDESSDQMRSIHFKVADLDAAIAEMQANGIRVLHNLRTGGLREAIFHPDDTFGVRINLVQYEEPSIIEAMLA